MTTIEKIQIPQDYYTEMVEEHARSYYTAKTNPARQKARIDAMLAKGKDYEVMSNGMKVSLSKVKGFYTEALLVDVSKLKDELISFKEKYQPNPNMYGDLKSAYKKVTKFRSENEHYDDGENNYSLLHDTSHKYYLSEIQMNDLMEYMMSLDLLH